MIKAVYSKIENAMPLSPDSPVLLISESPREYCNMVEQLINCFNGDQSQFSFFCEHNEISPEKYGELLVELFSFDYINKKIINLLYKKLQADYFNGDHIIKLNQINGEIVGFLSNLCAELDFSVEYDELSIENLLKTCSVRPVRQYESFLEKIICYINIYVSLKNINFFVFVGLKPLLSDCELEKLYKHCAFNKISLLLIESYKVRPLLKCERAIIITEDLCELVEQFEQT